MITLLSILLTLVLVTSFFIIRNLLLKNENLVDFIAKQSDAIDACDLKLKEIDAKGMFEADDSIGWFFKAVKDIQASLNEFTLK
tara:strand:- start:382 stop:633 length:252 start_codon:yes stop_codon:yes gene_type:complete